MSEAATVKKFIERLKKLRAAGAHVWWHKLAASPWGNGGCPDVLTCIDGAFLALEFKEAGNEASEIQKREIAAINAANGSALVVWNVEEAMTHVKQRLRKWEASR